MIAFDFAVTVIPSHSVEPSKEWPMWGFRGAPIPGLRVHSSTL